jgi:four helix bundle protein
VLHLAAFFDDKTSGIGRAEFLAMATSDLLKRTHLFALSVLKFCRCLPRTPEAQEAAGQLRRAANSVRSNYRAARRGRSRAEFQAKLGTVFEEADECAGWLGYLGDGNIQHDPVLVEEAQALARIFAKAVKTARMNTRRLKNLPDS